jgi:hypothetical protein
MDTIKQALNFSNGDSLTILLLAFVAGLAVTVVVVGLIAPPKGKPRKGVGFAYAGQLDLLSVRLERQQLGLSGTQFVTKGLTLGIPIAIVLYLLVGSYLLAICGVLVGFIMTQTKLEQKRDRDQIEYTKRLTSACDIIRAAYNVNPSLKKALDAVAEYGTSPCKEDFQEILVAASQERFVEGLHAVAEKRRSIVFDSVATCLTRANEASGEVNEMLIRLAESTRQNTSAFEEAMTSQINARSNIQWGVFGPWMIFAVFRVITLGLSLMSGGGGMFAPMNGFFSTPGGNVLVLGAALFSMWLYRNALSVAQRGLVVRRIVSEESSVQVGQRPLSGQNMISAQSRSMVSE